MYTLTWKNPVFSQVIETGVKVWKNKKGCKGAQIVQADVDDVSTALLNLPKLSPVSLWLDEDTDKFFISLLQNNEKRSGKCDSVERYDSVSSNLYRVFVR